MFAARQRNHSDARRNRELRRTHSQGTRDDEDPAGGEVSQRSIRAGASGLSDEPAVSHQNLY